MVSVQKVKEFRNLVYKGFYFLFHFLSIIQRIKDIFRNLIMWNTSSRVRLMGFGTNKFKLPTIESNILKFGQLQHPWKSNAWLKGLRRAFFRYCYEPISLYSKICIFERRTRKLHDNYPNLVRTKGPSSSLDQFRLSSLDLLPCSVAVSSLYAAESHNTGVH